MKQYTLSLLLFFPLAGWAQPEIQWQRRLGGSSTEEIRSVEQTMDGSFFILGHTASNDGNIDDNNGSVDFFGVKLSKDGELQWHKCYGGSANDWAYYAEQTRDGGFIMTGYTRSFDGDVNGNHGESDVWVVKIDSTGELIWQKCLGGSKREDGWEIHQTPDDGYIVFGNARSEDGDLVINQGFSDYWLIKLDVNGNLMWQKTYGGSSFDLGYSIALTTDGGYIVCGESQSDDGDIAGNIIGGLDAWVIKLDHEGKMEWQKEYGGSSEDRANEILQTSDGGYIFCGHSSSVDGDVNMNFGMIDFWIVKLNHHGEIEWSKTLGGSGQDNALSIDETSDGNFIITGILSSNEISGYHGSTDIWTIKLNNEGGLVWQKPLGGTQQEAGHSIHVTSDGGYMIGGYTWSEDGDVEGEIKGLNDFWILKLAPETSDAIEPVHPLLQIYPNPANTHIRVQGIDTQQDGQVIISDALGRIVMTRPLQTAASLELEPLPPGMYFLLARYADGKQMNGKFQKAE